MESLSNIPPYSLRFEHRISYLYAVTIGKRVNKESCKEIWKQVITECKLKQYNKILYERKIQGIGKVSDLREIVSDLSKYIDGEYIALLDNNPDHYQMNRLAEISASNLGLNVKFYTSIGEAKEWLLLQ